MHAPMLANLAGFFLSLYVYSGRLKNSAVLSWARIEIVVAVSFLLLCAISVRQWAKQPKPLLYRSEVVLMWISVASFLVGSKSGYAEKKLSSMFVYLFGTLILARLVSAVHPNVKKWVGDFSLGLGVISLVVEIAAKFFNNSLGDLLGNDYLGVSLSIYGGAIVALSRWSASLGPVYLALLCLHLFGLFISGSKGPFLLAVLASLFVMGRIFWSSGLRKNRFFVPVLLLLALLWIFSTEAGRVFKEASSIQGTTISRLQIMLESDGGGASIRSRLQFWEHSLKLFLSSPWIGVGLGTWQYQRNALIEYPHNFIFEILAETGLVGFFVWASVFLRRGLWLSENSLDEPSQTVRWLSWATITTNLLSSDVTGLRFVFLAIGLLGMQGIEDKLSPSK